MPKKRLPRGVKVMRGTDQPSRRGADLVEMVPAEGDFPPPDWFATTEAVAEWERLVPILRGLKVLTSGDLGPLAILCALYGDVTKKWEAGITPTASLVAQLRAMYSDFGLNPASRLSAPPKSGTVNPFAKHGPRLS